MALSARHREKALWMMALLVVLWVMVGCAEIKPYNPPNHREEGPQKGLFSGSEGDWVIFRGELAPDGDVQKTSSKEDPDKPTDDKKQ